MRGEPIIFHWAREDDSEGNWQHIFEGHDVELKEVVTLIEEYLGVPGVCIRRADKSYTITAASVTGRTLKAVFRVLHWDPPRVYVITCYPVDV